MLPVYLRTVALQRSETILRLRMGRSQHPEQRHRLDRLSRCKQDAARLFHKDGAVMRLDGRQPAQDPSNCLAGGTRLKQGTANRPRIAFGLEAIDRFSCSARRFKMPPEDGDVHE